MVTRDPFFFSFFLLLLRRRRRHLRGNIGKNPTQHPSNNVILVLSISM
jgi:hypothetical protein